MKIEDIKVGMKVVPFQKTARPWTNWESFMQEDSDCTKSFKEHGFLFIAVVDKGQNEIWLANKPNSRTWGSCFRPCDLKPYAEPAPKANIVEDWDIILGKFGAISIIDTVKVIRNGPATIVILKDGSKGVAKCHPDDAPSPAIGDDAYSPAIGFRWAYIRAMEAQLRKGEE